MGGSATDDDVDRPGSRSVCKIVAAATDVMGRAGVDEKVEVIAGEIENIESYSERSWMSCIERRGSLPVIIQDQINVQRMCAF